MDEDSGAPVALVTGAARRVGAAIAQRLHAEGWRVAIHCGRSRVEADALAATLNTKRVDSAAVFSFDLRAEAAATQLVAAVQVRWAAPAALVNNASSYLATPIGTVTGAAVDELIGTNLKAPLLLTQAAHAAGALRGVVNLLDAHSRYQPRARLSAYSAAKDALWALTESLAVELAPVVRVNGVALGHILAEVREPPTPAEALDLADKATQLGRIPLARFGTPQEVAAAVAWLLSSEAAYVSGAILPVDGARRLA
ncbi:MAG: SDR family oxidoreductase [Stagnimonas sp.]|nr:SDR family oxidoreductase [Stagnimonas sp.]